MKRRTTFALVCVCLAPAATRAQQPPLTKSIAIAAHPLIDAPIDSKEFAKRVRIDTPGHVIRDVVFGTVGGAVLGALIGSQTNKGSKEDRELAGLAGAVLGAGVGALAGVVVAVTHKSEH